MTEFYVLSMYSALPQYFQWEGFAIPISVLDKQQNKTVSTESRTIELAQLVLKNNYFEFDHQFRKQKEGTTIGTKCASPYAIMAALEEETLESFLKKPWL